MGKEEDENSCCHVSETITQNDSICYCINFQSNLMP